MPYRVSYLFLLVFIITSGISITISQASLLVSLIAWIYGLSRREDDIEYYKSGIEKYIVSFVFISIALAFFSSSVFDNLLYLRDFWLISVFVLISSLIKTRDDIVKIIRLLIFVAIFQSLAGMVGYATDINFLNTFKHGTGYHNSHLSMGYLVGFLGHHLTYGGYMMMLTIPLVYLSFIKKGEGDHRISAILVRISSVISMVALVLSWSRSAIIALPFAVFPIFFIHRKAFLIVFTLFVGLTLMIFSFFGPAKNILKNLNNVSSQIRIQIWSNAFKVWQKNPIVGAGGGNYCGEFKRVVQDNPKENHIFQLYFPTIVTHAHNDYLNQLARKGIIGLIAFLYMLYGILRYMIIKVRSLTNEGWLKYLFWGLFGSYCSFLIASMFQCYYTDEENLALFWFAIGLITSIVKVIELEKGKGFIA